jgi:hypothetical protein
MENINSKFSCSSSIELGGLSCHRRTALNVQGCVLDNTSEIQSVKIKVKKMLSARLGGRWRWRRSPTHL